MAVILDLDRRVDAAHGLKDRRLPVERGFAPKKFTRPQTVGNALDTVNLLPRQLKGGRVLSLEELERQDPHPDQITAMDPFVAFRDHGLHP